MLKGFEGNAEGNGKAVHACYKSLSAFCMISAQHAVNDHAEHAVQCTAVCQYS